MVLPPIPREGAGPVTTKGRESLSRAVCSHSLFSVLTSLATKPPLNRRPHGRGRRGLLILDLRSPRRFEVSAHVQATHPGAASLRV